MKRLIFALVILALLITSGYPAWKFNPHTGKLDYYEPSGTPADNALTPLKLKAVGTPDNTMVPFWDSSGLFRWATPVGGTITDNSLSGVKLTDNTVAEGKIVSLPWAKLTDVPTTFTPASHNNTAHSVAFLVATDNAAGLAAAYVDWNSSSGGASILNKPTLGTSAAKNIPATGDASATEVVYGTDTRLTNARTPSSHNNTSHSETYITSASAVAPNGAITPGTKTKIAYDAKGLVTSGADATKDDIGLGAVDNTSDATKNAATATLTNKMVALTEAPGSDNTATGIIVVLTAGENLVPGDVVYFKSDGKAWKADANAAGAYPAMGIAIATINTSATGNILLHGIVRSDQWNWTVGGVIYLSTTAGAMTQTQPTATDDVIQILGIATHADRMFFRPDLSWITHT